MFRLNKDQSEKPEKKPETKSQPEEKTFREKIPELQSQSQSESQSNEDQSSPEYSTEPDWQALGVDETPPEQVDDAPDNSQMLDEEQFHQLFCGGFTVAGKMTKLESLPVDEEDSAARGASGVIHKIIVRNPRFHFLINPANEHLQDLMILSAFFVPKTMMVKAELMMREQAAKQAKARAQAQDDGGNTPPPTKGGALVIPDFDMSGKNERV